MQPDEYGRLFEHEDSYWWFVGRRRLALRMLDWVAAKSSPTLDLGCGTGAVLAELSQRGWACGVDRFDLALQFCRKRGLPHLVLGDGTNLPLRTGTFRAAIALDIFEHIDDDEEALEEAFRVLRPGGFLILSVPAYTWLWGPHDVALMHHRRYTLNQLKRKLRAAGFTIERISYSVFFLFPVVVGVRLLDKIRRGPAKVSLPAVPSWLNRWLIRLQDFEGRLIERMRLPWGSSVVAIAKKPD